VSTGMNQLRCAGAGRRDDLAKCSLLGAFKIDCPFSDATLIHSLHLSRSSQTNKTRTAKVLTVGWTGGELLTAHLGGGRVAGGWMHTSLFIIFSNSNSAKDPKSS
jgi:hypothetical protein